MQTHRSHVYLTQQVIFLNHQIWSNLFICVFILFGIYLRSTFGVDEAPIRVHQSSSLSWFTQQSYHQPSCSRTIEEAIEPDNVMLAAPEKGRYPPIDERMKRKNCINLIYLIHHYFVLMVISAGVGLSGPSSSFPTTPTRRPTVTIQETEKEKKADDCSIDDRRRWLVIRTRFGSIIIIIVVSIGR